MSVIYTEVKHARAKPDSCNGRSRSGVTLLAGYSLFNAANLREKRYRTERTCTLRPRQGRA
jgi:hypothetical protein